MRFLVAWIALAAVLTAGITHGQSIPSWDHVPTISVVSASADDPRFKLVDEAVTFWNRKLRALGSGFRLGKVTRVVRTVPEDDVRFMRRRSGRSQEPMTLPPSLEDISGNLIVVLADSNFVSFTAPWVAGSKRVIAVKGLEFDPLSLPNVARNVITHELGHAIGLEHNSDPTTLMCGRPSSCRPDAFQAEKPAIFPLTKSEEGDLRAMYPKRWKAIS